MRKAQSGVSISLGPLMTMQGDTYSVQRSGAGADEKFKLACPESTDADVHGASQHYVCDQHGDVGTVGEMKHRKEISKGQFILVDEEEIAAAKESDLEKGVLSVAAHPVTDVDKHTFPYGSAYVFVPAARNPLHSVLLAVLSDPDCEYALMGEMLGVRGGTKLVRLEAWHNQLVIQELLRPEDTNEFDDLTTPVEDKHVTMTLNLLGQLAEEFDPEEYRNRTAERVKALVEAKLNGTNVAVATTTAPVKDPMADFEAMLAASVQQAATA